MSILINKSNKVIVQGITGENASFHTGRMLKYGTNIVGGVTPEKGGTEHLGLPVFDSVREAVEETKANTSIIFISPPFAADHMMEAADAGVELCICVTGRIPSQDMIRVKRYIRSFEEPNQMRLIGPGSAGIISPGKALVGIMPGYLYDEGKVGVISRSGTLGFEAASQLNKVGIGISTSIGIGSEAITGSSFVELLKEFESDPDTDAVVLIGEIGGVMEIDAAHYLKENMKKPVIGYIAGLTAPKGRRMGHAGAIISAYGESAAEKIEILQQCGVIVVPAPSAFGETIKQVL
jgi:malate-CoA ligase subunit alpha